MTDFTTQQHFQFRVTGVTGNYFQSDTRQNVQKRVEKILYLESPPDDAVLLSYVGSSELSPTNNLFIGDRSDALYANSRVGRVQEFISDIQPVQVRNSNFIVTQVFNEADSGSIPLYYKHVLSIDIVAESVRLYDKDFNPVSADKYKLEIQEEYSEDTGLPLSTYTEYYLYNNLKNSYDPDTGEYEVYFVQYTDSSGSTDVTYTELLSNEIIYREATLEDIWTKTSDLKPWTKAYINSELSITLPVGTEFAVQYQENRRISVKPPVALDDTRPWFTRVVNGEFTTGYDSYTVKYSIPEFENQAFNPLEPYKLAVRTGCDKISDYLVKFPNDGLQEGSMFSYIYVLFEKDGVVEYAVTNDPSTATTEYKDFDNERVLDSDGDPILWSSATLLGVDNLNGIIHVSFKVEDSHDILATYSYEEYLYELTGLNMNPIFDTEAHKELRALYIVPQSLINANQSSQTQSIEWLKISPSGLINSLSQDSTGGNEDISADVGLSSAAGYGLLGTVGLHYNWRASSTASSTQEIIYSQALSVVSASRFPYRGWIRFLDTSNIYRYAKFVDRTDTTLVLSSSQSQVAYEAAGLFVSSGTTIELVNFIDERTTISVRGTDETGYTYGSAVPVHYSRYFLLAELSINPPHSHKDLVRIDVRENGGGVKSSSYEDAKLLNPKVQWLADLGDYDGQVYPGDAVLVVKLPIALLDTYTESELYDILEQNVPFGIQPLIRYYGYTPNVLYVGPQESAP